MLLANLSVYIQICCIFITAVRAAYILHTKLQINAIYYIVSEF